MQVENVGKEELKGVDSGADSGLADSTFLARLHHEQGGSEHRVRLWASACVGSSKIFRSLIEHMLVRFPGDKTDLLNITNTGTSLWLGVFASSGILSKRRTYCIGWKATASITAGQVRRYKELKKKLQYGAGEDLIPRSCSIF